MSARSTTFELEKLRREWDLRARTAPEPDGDVWAPDGGSDLVCLEIGCASGRMTRALAERFGTIYAVDISGAMVERARLATSGLPNVHIFQNSGRNLDALAGVTLDLALCFGVFQHVSRTIVEDYVRATAALLRAGGLFQFDVLDSAAETACEGHAFTLSELRGLAALYDFEMEGDHRALRWVKAA